MMQDRTAQTDQSWLVSLTGQYRQVGQDSTERTGCQDMTEGPECGDRWARDKSDGVGRLGQDRWDKTARTGQPEKTVGIIQYSQERKQRTGWLEHDRKDRTAWDQWRSSQLQSSLLQSSQVTKLPMVLSSKIIKFPITMFPSYTIPRHEIPNFSFT